MSNAPVWAGLAVMFYGLGVAFTFGYMCVGAQDFRDRLAVLWLCLFWPLWLILWTLAQAVLAYDQIRNPRSRFRTWLRRFTHKG